MFSPKTARGSDDGDDAAVAAAAAAITNSPRALLLECGVRHYRWGDPEFIPRLLGRPNRSGQPYAELWIGAHPELPSVARIDELAVPLNRLIEAAPEILLGRYVSERFGGKLPFLFKVLSAAQPLSIQVHPDQKQARAGSDREDRARIPIGDAKRSYRDGNHKPELLVALTDFYALHGFRTPDEIVKMLIATPELAGLAGGLDAGTEAVADLYRRLMRMPQQAVNAWLDPLLERLNAERPDSGQQASQDPDTAADRCEPFHWLLLADRAYSLPGRRDRGLFSILLLNLIHLRPGEGLFLPARELHSYLQGAGVELMANSNNVLRGGLTPKHIDVEELLRVVRFDAGPAKLISPRALRDGQWRYRVPAEEFQLDVWELRAGEQRQSASADVRLGLLLDGEVELAGNGHRLPLSAGQAFLIPARCEAGLRANRATTVYFATVPDNREDSTQRPAS